MINPWLIPSNNIKKKLISLFSHRTLLLSCWHTAITRLRVNTHCFGTGVEKGMELCTAVQEDCGYKNKLRAHRYFALLAKYFTACITYQPPIVYMTKTYGDLHTWNWNTICTNLGCFGHRFSGGKTIGRPTWRWEKNEWNSKSYICRIYLAPNKVEWCDVLDTIISLPVTWMTGNLATWSVIRCFHIFHFLFVGG
jgi:hypothetical protein